MTPTSKFDAMVGRPFVLLPGNPPDHVVLGESKRDGHKIRCAGVMTVWNDMLLVDAVEGPGTYLIRAGQREAEYLEVAERHYGCSAGDAIRVWLELGFLYTSVEWPKQEAGR